MTRKCAHTPPPSPQSEHTPIPGPLALPPTLGETTTWQCPGFSFNKSNLFLQRKTIGKRAGNLTPQTCSLLTVIWNSNCWTGRGRLAKGGNEKKLRDAYFISDFTVNDNRKATKMPKSKAGRMAGSEWCRQANAQVQPLGPHDGELIPQLHCRLFSAGPTLCVRNSYMFKAKHTLSWPAKNKGPQAHIKFKISIHGLVENTFICWDI